ncbi:MAG TPA: DUF72 domain-containing protein [Terriglobales bacterium]|jgi:uncharacterized protein YecE (DUF72 family)|nr:DUF72 domain-containing protein [Terriglobales bacterium]
MAKIYVGTSGWAYPTWKPDFYPPKLAQAKFLGHYATQLNAVEVNFTFRQLLKDTTAQKWIAGTPDNFLFTAKAHQVLTHIKRLKNIEDFLPRFISTLEPIANAGKLGPLLFQLPPNMKADVVLLEDFLKILPRGVMAAFEFRNLSWFTDETYDLLRKYNRALCVAETEERETPDVVTADFCYYRYRKPTYTEEERSVMVQRMREHIQNNRNVFAYFKHEDTPQGALYAVDVLKQFTAD